jgi:deoxyribodipyrimidine photo-lyase
MASSTAIALFTRDLRVHDNPTLAGAADSADRVLPVFVLDDAILGSRYLAPNDRRRGRGSTAVPRCA